MPEDWKKANIVPLYKGGSKFAPANYRPVNLTVSVMNIMESIVKDDIVGHWVGWGCQRLHLQT